MSIAFADSEVPSGVLNGINSTFTLANPPSPAQSLLLERNGITQTAGTDFTLASSAITFVLPPQATDTLRAWYRYIAASTITGFGPTVDDLLRSSFRCINQLRPGFGHSPSERVDALFVLNAMLEQWGLDDLNCYCTLISSFPLTGLTQYTVGPSGNFNMARPVKVDKATLVVLTNAAQPLRLNLKLLNAEQFQSIHLQRIASQIPQWAFYNPAYVGGLATLNLWPLDQGNANVELSTQQALSGGFTDGSTIFSAPPGYLDAVRYNLAVRLAMEWNQPLKEGVVKLADESLAMVQRRNDVTPQMTCNPGVLPSSGSHGGGFNWFTGE